MCVASCCPAHLNRVFLGIGQEISRAVMVEHNAVEDGDTCRGQRIKLELVKIRVGLKSFL